MTKIYKIEQGGVCVEREVTLSRLSGCFEVENYTDNQGTEITRSIEELTFSIPVSLSEDLVVYFEYILIESDDFGGYDETTIQDTVTILAGQTSVVYELTCLYTTFKDYGSGGEALFT